MPLMNAPALPDRRQLMKAAVAFGATASIGPFVHAASRTQAKVIGQGEYRYEVTHHWPELPSEFTWQTTHNVAVDKADNLYVIHEGNAGLKDHPAIFVFDPQGKYIRSFASSYQGGGHGLEVRQEGNEEFLYVTGYQNLKKFSKMTLKGELVWEQRAPLASQVYAEDEAAEATTTPDGGRFKRDRFMPTNFAFLDDGGFLLADGYGAWRIHRFDKEAKWVSSFGGPGDGKGTFNTPHGLWVDARDKAKPVIVVTDRAHDTLQRFTLDGQYIDTLTGFGLPANLDVQGDLLMVPELKARISLLGRDNQVVATLGDDVQRITGEGGGAIRNDEAQWQDGKFVHPHDACFDSQGNIFVAEWVRTGRVSKLRRV